MSDDWTRVKEILAEALEQPETERDSFLAVACQDEPILRARVDALVRSHEEAGDFLSAPTREAGPETVDLALSESPGTIIGRYKLLQKIGEGGFGVVYMAEQREPVKRKVALKVIKLGMDTDQVVARFEAERQALALMEHPSIAKVLDGGTTTSGRPYFVMELVRGVPITEYCDAENLSPGDRLQLFVEVCQAVQHAHTKGIIHRDLKPSNVLVTLHDGKPVPKVIDFGIAKAVDRELTDRTLFTEYRQFVGTPEYMSPEQAALSGLDIDTRSDVYALGVLLYQLLTGTTPLDAMELRRAGLDEVHRLIRETNPPKPSTRVDSLVTEARAGSSAISDIARHRGTVPGDLSRAIRGDLDWIVMKALEKDRRRRYDTASSLADDIRRHLGDEPVLASPPGLLYTFGKFARRHRGALAAAVSIVVILILGLAATTTALVALKGKNDQLQTAQAELRQEVERTRSVSHFLKSTFESQNPFETPGTGKSIAEVTVKELVDGAARRVDGELGAKPLLEAEIRATLGKTYRGLGELDGAMDQLRRASEIRDRLLGVGDRVALTCRLDYASAVYERGYHVEAARITESVIRDATQHLGADDVFTLVARLRLVRSWQRLRKFDEVIRATDEVISQAAKLPSDTQLFLGSTRFDPDRITHRALYLRTTSRLYAGRDVEEALADCARVVAWARSGPRDLARSHILAGCSDLYENIGRFEEARELAEEAARHFRQTLGENHPWVVEGDAHEAWTSYLSGRIEESVARYRQVLDRLEARFDSSSDYVLGVRSGFAYALVEAGRAQEAQRYMGDRLAQRERECEGHRGATCWLRLEYGWMVLESGDLETAGPIIEAGLRDVEATHPPTALWMPWKRAIHGFYELKRGRLAKAEEELLAAEVACRTTQGTRLVTYHRMLRWLVELYEAKGDEARAAEWRLKLETR